MSPAKFSVLLRIFAGALILGLLATTVYFGFNSPTSSQASVSTTLQPEVTENGVKRYIPAGTATSECSPQKLIGNGSKRPTIVHKGDTLNCSFIFFLTEKSFSSSSSSVSLLSPDLVARQIKVGVKNNSGDSLTATQLSNTCSYDGTGFSSDFTSNWGKLTCIGVPTGHLSNGYKENSFYFIHPGTITQVQIGADIQVGTCADGGKYPQCQCQQSVSDWYTLGITWGSDNWVGSDYRTCYSTLDLRVCLSPIAQALRNLSNQAYGEFETKRISFNNERTKRGIGASSNLCTSKSFTTQLMRWRAELENPLVMNFMKQAFTGRVTGGAEIQWSRVFNAVETSNWGGNPCQGRVPVLFGDDSLLFWSMCYDNFEESYNNYISGSSNPVDYIAGTASLRGVDNGGSLVHEMMHVLDGNSAYEIDWSLNIGYAKQWQGYNISGFEYPNLASKLLMGWNACKDKWYPLIGEIPTAAEGFINCYGKTDTLEDRAVILASMVTPNQKEKNLFYNKYYGINRDLAGNPIPRDPYFRSKVQALLEYMYRELGIKNIDNGINYNPETEDPKPPSEQNYPDAPPVRVTDTIGPKYNGPELIFPSNFGPTNFSSNLMIRVPKFEDAFIDVTSSTIPNSAPSGIDWTYHRDLIPSASADPSFKYICLGTSLGNVQQAFTVMRSQYAYNNPPNKYCKISLKDLAGNISDITIPIKEFDGYIPVSSKSNSVNLDTSRQMSFRATDMINYDVRGKIKSYVDSDTMLLYVVDDVEGEVSIPVNSKTPYKTQFGSFISDPDGMGFRFNGADRGTSKLPFSIGFGINDQWNGLYFPRFQPNFINTNFNPNTPPITLATISRTVESGQATAFDFLNTPVSPQTVRIESQTFPYFSAQENGVAFTPATGFSGEARMTYTAYNTSTLQRYTGTIIVTVNPPRDPTPPVVVNDSVTTTNNIATDVNVLANDETSRLDPTTIQLVSGSQVGGDFLVLTSTTPLRIRYIPSSNFTGVAQVKYTVANRSGVRSAQATLFLQVNNPTPISSSSSTPTPTPSTVVAPITTLPDTASVANPNLAFIDVLANDTSAQPLVPSTLTVVGTQTGGTFVSRLLTLNGRPTQIIQYTPTSGFVGTARATYTVANSAGTVSAPTQITVTVTSGSGPTATPIATPTPTPISTQITTRTPTPTPTLVAPVVRADTVSIQNNVVATIDVLANDDLANINQSSLLLASTTGNGTWGTVVVNGRTQIRYTPAAGFVGSASNTYTVTGLNGVRTSPVLITVNVSAAPTPIPVNTQPDTASTLNTQILNIQVLANDSSNSPLVASSLAVVGTQTGGTFTARSVTINNAPVQVVQFTPTAGFVGTARATYTIANQAGTVSAPTQITVNVTPAPTPTPTPRPSPTPVPTTAIPAPVGQPDRVTIRNTQIATINVMADDSGTNINFSSLQLATNSSNGTWSVVVINGISQVRYTPTAGFVGTATNTYTIASTNGARTGPISITVTVRANSSTTPVPTPTRPWWQWW